MSLEVELNPWSKVSQRGFDSWHSMCSYLGSYPAPLANYFIRHFSKENEWVMDPFSGRGTTVLEGAILKRKVVATDLNPIALALTKAKLQDVTKEAAFNRVDELQGKYDPALYRPEALAQDDAVHLIFHPNTLAQLCFLKRKLLKSSDPVDQFLIGCILGILHGGERKDGSSGYVSISMPNTFSMSPEYVRRFVQTKELQREFRDVFSLLKNKVERLYEKHKRIEGETICLKQDAKSLSNAEGLKHLKGKVSLIMCSPPYLGIVNYAKQNWIRSWFLNESPDEVSKELDDDLNLEEWISFSRKVAQEIKCFLKKDGVAVFVIGDVARSKTSVISLAREFSMMVKENGYFKNVWCISDSIKGHDKTTRIWGDSKGNATAIDRIVILSDVNPFETVHSDESFEPLSYIDVLNSTKEFISI